MRLPDAVARQVATHTWRAPVAPDDEPTPTWDQVSGLLAACLPRVSDDAIGAAARRLARRILADYRRRHRGWAIRDGFLPDMARRDNLGWGLTPGQVRGVLNCALGSVRANQRRFWKSRPTRRDRFDGVAGCLVCGGPLVDPEAAARGLGRTCWQRVVENL